MEQGTSAQRRASAPKDGIDRLVVPHLLLVHEQHRLFAVCLADEERGLLPLAADPDDREQLDAVPKDIEAAGQPSHQVGPAEDLLVGEVLLKLAAPVLLLDFLLLVQEESRAGLGLVHDVRLANRVVDSARRPS